MNNSSMSQAREGKARSIRMPEEVWDALDADADRCVRSSTGQMEAILRAYYGIGAVELKLPDETRQQVSPTLSTVEVSQPYMRARNSKAKSEVDRIQADARKREEKKERN